MLLGYGLNVSDGSGCVQKIYLNNSTNCETPIAKSKDPRIGTPCTNWSVICRQDLQLTITDLLPDTSYTITVFAINGAPQNNGWGSPSSLNRTTAIAVPSNINNFTAKWTTNISVNLTWSTPVPRPGPTNYTLVTTDLGPLYYSYRGAFSTNKTLITGFDSHEYLVKELRPAWNYSFTLSSQTLAGSSQTTTTTAQTQDSVPGVVQNLTVTPGHEAYKQQTASWRCPGVTERNTRIIGFLLNTTSWNINGDKKEDSSAAQKNQCSVGICFVNVTDVGCENTQSVDIVVKPEHHYLIQVVILSL
ncbi:uncharacterized protein LOC112566448 [Pomacea canaliculata]|uniref:uncharacterized protein LOC112566448 n=1 Tax=Pomacea canaliculata TaxID=400727 RepID=UPI000D727E7A|nr:uncharacterized protein LOC112566448 [Pomacea canaliculata]